ncbi:hypothetical protein B0H14DRAFT_3752417 [Mycena olivaceomarginata]|nr:hypothetical protein B0H14DRAFT_3752417 [Mycena olivaceomarginata]
MDEFLRLHFRFSLSVQLRGGDIRDDYPLGSILAMMDELGVPHAMTENPEECVMAALSDARWQTVLGRAILADAVKHQVTQSFHCNKSVDEDAEDDRRRCSSRASMYHLAKPPLPESCALRPPSTALSGPNVYIKRTKPFHYDPVEPAPFSPADFQANEMRLCEMLRERPYPNICRYLEYVPTPDGEYVAGLCFERLHIDLVRARDEGFSFDACAVVEAAILLSSIFTASHTAIGDEGSGHWTSDGGNDYHDLRSLQKWLDEDDSPTTEEEDEEEEELASGS